MNRCLTSCFLPCTLSPTGKVFVPKQRVDSVDDEDKIVLDIDEEASLNGASEADLVDLAGILGLHSMLNQDQYHASILNKGQGAAANFQSIVKASPPKKQVPNLPDNDTDVTKTTQQVKDNDSTLKDLNWNNIKHVPRETFKKLFDGLANNTTLERLSLSNTGLTDGPAEVSSHSVNSLLSGLMNVFFLSVSLSFRLLSSSFCLLSVLFLSVSFLSF